jgi:hypothetical protein
MHGYSKKEKINIVYILIMETATIIIIFFCLMLAVYNRKFIPIALVAIALYMYYLQSSNKSTLYSVNGKLYLNSILPKEHFQDYVPDLSRVGPANDYLNQNWNTMCKADNSMCSEINISKSSLSETIQGFETYIEGLTEEQLEELKSFLVDNEEWQFASKQYVYDVRHKHNTVGELIYHLKDIDNTIFIKLFNEIGYTENIIEDLYDKVNDTLIKKAYLDITDGSLIEKKIKLVHEILTELKKKYVEFQNSDNAFTISNIPIFKKTETCKIVKQETPYNNFNYESFSNMELGCPGNHYLKGMTFDVNKETGRLTKNFHCCEINQNPSNYSFNESITEFPLAQHVLNEVQCENDGILSNFMFEKSQISDEIGNLENIEYSQKNVFNNGIYMSGFTNYDITINPYLIYIYKQNFIFQKSDINPIISMLNRKSSDTKYVLASNTLISGNTFVDNSNIGFYEAGSDSMLGSLSSNRLTTPSSVSSNQIGIYVIAYGIYNKIKHHVSSINNHSITKIGNGLSLNDSLKTAFNITEIPASTTVRFNGNYIKSQDTYININNESLKLKYDSIVRHWCLHLNDIPIYVFASVASTTTESPERDFDFIGDSISVYDYGNISTTINVSVKLIEETEKTFDTIIVINIPNKQIYSGAYIQKAISNNRPVYVKKNNNLIRIQWSSDQRRWELLESGVPKLANSNDSELNFPENHWFNIDTPSTTFSISKDTEILNNEESYKKYLLLNKNNEILAPKLDIISKRFILENTGKKYRNNSDDKENKLFLFNIMRNNNTISFKNIQLELYLSLTNDAKVIFSKKENKQDFELININSNYSFRIPNENKLLTLRRLVIGIEPSIDLRNPLNEQIFQIVNVKSNNEFPLKVNKGCYINNSSANGTTPTLNEIPINLGENIENLHGKELLCNNNQHITTLLGSKDNLTIKCRNNSEVISGVEVINDKRLLFFNLPVTDFYHTHDFIVQDPIHQFKVKDDLTYNSKNLDNQLELYSSKYNTYLNQTSAYSSLQKMFIMMVMLKIQKINRVKLDIDTLYEYFSKQVVIDQYYELLVNSS